ncbi:extracellular solute-binding protein [Paenibacillus piri]|uniref:Extracellular solute-binding protein n=1 Tax=Paenibacillus piri TaxID=2547395 RepID=A0A4R5KQN2_9BACL|nr:extracellular solute-binding protein [Paenibacillus piri]TDF98051.1 extracellular solute-binding protein [Paenibacillus piri]
MRGSKWKTVTSSLTASLLVAGLLAGCSKGADGGAADGNTTDGKSKKTMELVWLSFNPPENDSTPVQQKLEKQFNVKFKNIRIERAQYDQQMNLKFSTGEIADVIYLDSSPERMNELVKQGVLAELPEAEIKKNMPNYSKTIDQADPTSWTYALVDGKSYGIPIIWPLGSLPFLTGYNGDWLKKIGYDKAPETLEQFEDVLRKFRNNDPDGNGKKDTYGYSAQGTGATSFNTVFSAFQVRTDWMIDDKTGKIVYGLTTDGAREAFKVLNKWYKEGLIDPEFVTKKTNDYHNDFVNGKVGVRDWMSYQFEPDVGIIGAPFYAKNQNNKIVIGKPLTGPNGPGRAYSYGAKNAFVAMGAQVNKDPEKKQRIYEMLEALATDDQTYLTAVYGLEGEHYQMVGGKPIMKSEYANENAKYKIGAGTFYGLFGNKSLNMDKYDFPEDRMKFIKDLGNGVKTRESLNLATPAIKKYPDISKIEQEHYIKFITGEIDLNTGFDKFVELWKKSGGQEITDELNKKYAGVFK